MIRNAKPGERVKVIKGMREQWAGKQKIASARGGSEGLIMGVDRRAGRRPAIFVMIDPPGLGTMLFWADELERIK